MTVEPLWPATLSALEPSGIQWKLVSFGYNALSYGRCSRLLVNMLLRKLANLLR